MAVNPMQKKARISFILGFFVMFLIAAIVGAILFMQILNLKKENQDRMAKEKTVYMLARDIKSGEELTDSDIVSGSVITSMAQNNTVTPKYLSETNLIAKIDLPKGAILTTSMITPSDEKITDDLRMQEYNMLLLPSDLEKNDYIDIRFQYPNGQNYIVVSRKRVISASQNTIFLKMNEIEIETLTNAIVESYILEGSLLYANKFEDAGIQKASTPTYVVSEQVYNMIMNNPNITTTAAQALGERVSANINRRGEINAMLNESTQGTSGVQTGIETQIQRQNAERTKYIDMLGTD